MIHGATLNLRTSCPPVFLFKFRKGSLRGRSPQAIADGVPRSFARRLFHVEDVASARIESMERSVETSRIRFRITRERLDDRRALHRGVVEVQAPNARSFRDALTYDARDVIRRRE